MEIKFRAWDKQRKKMLYSGFCIVPTQPTWGAFNYDSNISDEIGQIYLQKGQDSMMAKTGDYSVFDWADYYGLSEYELMQFTGLKDKNGKEIYEGDICLAALPEERFKVTVIHEPPIAAFIFQWPDSTYESGMDEMLMDCFTDIEVIGNIHENPKLLGEEQNESSNN